MKTVGLDLARVGDFTVAAVVVDYDVRLIEQFPHGLKYREIVAQAAQYVDAADMTFVDAGGLGDPVCELLREDFPNKITAIKITGGESAYLTGRDWTVPKALLMETLASAFSRGVITVSAPNPGRAILEEEFKHFIYKPGRNPKYEAAAGHHDDTVLAVALAVFGRTLHDQRTER
jgi:hypothetical protein